MHICLIAPNDGLSDPRAKVSWHLLKKAGHDVAFVTVGDDGGDGVIPVDSTPSSWTQRIANRRRTPEERRTRLVRQLADAAGETGADLFVPTDPRALDAAVQAAETANGYVARTPKMADAGPRDLIRVAPEHAQAAAPIPGLGSLHTPDDGRAPYEPKQNRHAGRRVVLCYRRSEINPGRYLEAALRRSGVELRVETRAIDLDSIDASTDVVVFVEGPYPALDVRGETPVPTLFWAHHGEHHLHANLRLADHYRADAVLLAHSWHLAFWFPTPVHRFPFGMDPTLLRPGQKLEDRRYDVAMVGAGLEKGAQYGRRQELVAALRSSIPEDRLGFREQVSAEEMADLYATSRIVINEGGTRHYPITMRVLEAVGSGSILLSDPLPGMTMLLEPGDQFVELGTDVAKDVERILEQMDESQTMADSALATARGLHTYDHRVDELLQIAASTSKRQIDSSMPESNLARVIAADVETQRVGQWNAPDLSRELLDREVWDTRTMDRSRLEPGKMETVAIRSDDVTQLTWLLRSARRYAYIEGAARGLEGFLLEWARQATTSRIGEVTRVDFHAPSYRVMDFEDRT